ncbi:MAG: AMP-binding protein [Paludibacteraceae bacterium]|nr:AMP-binding protein [Paludibacteraceae bacterium]
MQHYLAYLDSMIAHYPDQPALVDYAGDDARSYTFSELGRQIRHLNVLFDRLGLQAGDKIALAGRNCANWAVAYLAIAAYRGVIVSILQDFVAEDICRLLRHSDSRMLFVGPYVWDQLKQEEVPEMEAVLSLSDFTMLCGTKEAWLRWEEWREMPVSTEEFAGFCTYNIDDLVLINYTSGSTGNPKGVMLTNRSLSNNVEVGRETLPVLPGEKIVSMLPLAHMYGQVCELLYPLVSGCTVYFLSRTPTPAILLKALHDVQPYLVVTVPLVIEKIYKKHIAPIVNKRNIRFWWHVPIVGNIIRGVVKRNLKKTFGGKLRYFICGGAAMDEDVERCLMDVRFPLSVGYGMTECGPLIGGEMVHRFKARSGGKPVRGMEVRVDNPDENGVGELQVRGDNILIGYYKNEEATAQAFTRDGWFRTGDLGMMDKKRNIFIKGRIKTMILGSTGQNIYPEDIESRLNNEQAVEESLVVEREGKLVALIFPDRTIAEHEPTLRQQMDELLQRINKMLPSYSKVHHVEVVPKEFEKTPKRSIKRFLYH